MATGILETMKQAALDAFEASKPATVMFGTVTNANPIEITVSPSLILKESDGVLSLSRAVTDYDTEITLKTPWETNSVSGGSGETSFASHNHNISGKHSVTIHNALKLGDYVILVRVQGGQKFVVLDKLGD